MLNYHSLETFGTHEGPGIRLVLFLQGCHFKCLYCHNPDTIDPKAGKPLEEKKVLELLEKGRGYYQSKGGLTVSGGEPCLQAKELTPLFKKVKENGFRTALDTNGYILTDDVKKLLEYTDLVLLDVKHIDNDWHKKITGRPNTSTLKTADYLREINKSTWLRYVLVPGYSDQPEFLEEWAKHFENYENVDRVEILPYHTLGAYKYKELGMKYELEGVKTPTPEEINRAKEIFGKYLGKKVFVR